MSAIKTGKIAHSRFDQLAEQQLAEQSSHSKSNAYGGKIERSGGGIWSISSSVKFYEKSKLSHRMNEIYRMSQ